MTHPPTQNEQTHLTGGFQIGDTFRYDGENVEITEITDVDGTVLLWHGDDCYLGSEAYPIHWTEADKASMVQMVETAITAPECAECIRILKLLCTDYMKKVIWIMLSPTAQSKLREQQKRAA